MFPFIMTVLFVAALVVGGLVFRKSRKDNMSPDQSTAHEVLAVEFEHLRSKGDKPVVVMFFATWCTACVAQTPSFRRVANKLDSLAHFVFIDVDKNKSLANRMEIRKIPVLMVFTNDESRNAKHIGVLNDEDLTEFVQNATRGQ